MQETILNKSGNGNNVVPGVKTTHGRSVSTASVSLAVTPGKGGPAGGSGLTLCLRPHVVSQATCCVSGLTLWLLW